MEERPRIPQIVIVCCCPSQFKKWPSCLKPQGVEKWDGDFDAVDADAAADTAICNAAANVSTTDEMQMQMAAMERRAEPSEKYLRRIAKTMGDRNNKRKRGGFDCNDGSSDEDE